MKSNSMVAYLNNKVTNPNGTYTFHTFKVPCKIVEMRHHKLGLQYTASGYGKKIPTVYMVQVNNRWRRVYCCIYSNIGTLYITSPNGEWITVQTIEDHDDNTGEVWTRY